jgi:hypothetical protein
MSAASARRLKRLEEEMTPDTSWTAHIIWAHTSEAFEWQRAEMLADGRGHARDMFLWDIPKDGEPISPPKTETYDKPWAALLDEMAEEDRRREMAQ